MKKRKIISAAIILSGFALFLLIVILPNKNWPGSGTANAPNSGQNGSSGLDFETNQNRNLVVNPSTIQTKATDPENLTDLMAQGLSKNILEMNSESSQATSTIKLPSPDLLSNAIDQSFSSQVLRFPTFSQKDIRIGSDNSTDAQVVYIQAIGEITKKNFAGFNTPILTILSDFFEKNSSGNLVKYLDIARKEVSDLLALGVPQQLSVWHLQNLNLWEKKLVVYRAILDFDSDPLKATLALQEINNVGQENDNVQSTLNDYIKKLTANG